MSNKNNPVIKKVEIETIKNRKVDWVEKTIKINDTPRIIVSSK